MPKQIVCLSEQLQRCFVHALENASESALRRTAGFDRMLKAEVDDGFVTPILVLPGPGHLVHADYQQSVYLLKNQ